MQTRHMNHEEHPTLWERISHHTQPCWKFWHPGSGLFGGLVAAIIVIVVAPPLWRALFT